MAELQDLFASLKPQTQPAEGSSQSSQQPQPPLWAHPHGQHPYRPPTVSSPLWSPPVHTPNPVHSSNILSPVNGSSSTDLPAADQQRTNNLLNLLKFSGPSGQSGSPAGGLPVSASNVGAARATAFAAAPSGPAAGAPRTLSAQDLFASMPSRPSPPGVAPSPQPTVGAEVVAPRPVPAAGNPQDYLLNLLRKPAEQTPVVQSIEPETGAPQDTEKPDAAVDALTRRFAEAAVQSAATATSGSQRESLPIRQFGSAASRENTPFEAPQPAQTGTFTAANPFDAHHSSSPRNRTPKPDAHAKTEPKKIEILKHNRDSSGLNGESPAAPSAKTRKVDPLPTAPTAPEPETNKSSVSEALDAVGEKVDKQVGQSLAKAEKQNKPAEKQNKPAARPDTEPPVKKEVRDGVDSSWESAEDSANEKRPEFKVKVYNFPMRPFVAVTIKPSPEPAPPVRSDNFMNIANLKKGFDQMDRSLIAASQTYIVYAQLGTKKDNGGFRVIRQETGDHKQVFRSSGERVFNVQICSSTTPGQDVESVLTTGVNGSVFWTSLAKGQPDVFKDEDVEAQGFVMPAVPTPEENTSNSPVKTRAKCSSRHPEFFAVSRSKTIHIIAPEKAKDPAYCNFRTRKVDTVKYLRERGLQINTGKAGKDFTFSDDDSVIASLDKNSVIKFWDVRELTARASDSTAGTHDPLELNRPLWSLTATVLGSRPDEKPSVSSVTLLDKERPHNKGIALRYMLVGFKQNHILQLWDLALGKAVQELRFPHEKDSDGICSVTYHPKTGIIALGHPTRNSVYFLHVSAPRYNVPIMDQARYISLLAQDDQGLPKPESTAIMSGLREFSFANVGELRSLEMLKTPVETATPKGTVEETLFELYIMHSKGVLAMSIKRPDLGWDAQNKMVDAVDALKAGIVDVQDASVAPPKPGGVAESEAPTQAVEPPKKKDTKKQDQAKATAAPKSTDAAKKRRAASPAMAPTNGAIGTEAAPEQPLKQASEVSSTSQQPSVDPPLRTPDSYAAAAQRHKLSGGEGVSEVAEKAVTSPPKPAAASAAPAPSAVDDNVQSALTKQFDSLYQRIDADKRVSEAAGAAKQDAMLRLVSSTLTDNVEQSLQRIIGAGIEKEVIPALTNVTSKLIDSKLGKLLPQLLGSNVQREIKAALPGSIQQALKDQQVHRHISETTASNVAQKVQSQVNNLLQQSLPNLVTQATHNMITDLEARTAQRLRDAELQRQQDNAKIDMLTGMIRSLTESVQSMADTQVALEQRVLTALQERRRDGPTPAAETPIATAIPTIDPQKAVEEEEVQRITDMLVAGDYDGATIQWLQSANQARLFDDLFVRVNPQYLQRVTPLVALSVSAALTSSLETKTHERLDWLATVLSQINVRDPDIHDVAPKIMEVLNQRLQGAYMQISERQPSDQAVLRKISTLTRTVGEVMRLTG